MKQSILKYAAFILLLGFIVYAVINWPGRKYVQTGVSVPVYDQNQYKIDIHTLYKQLDSMGWDTVNTIYIQTGPNEWKVED
jgi:hypothetical protein